jgi:hypothetical protein
MSPQNFTQLILLVAALGTSMGTLAIDEPSAGSLGSELKQDPVKPGERDLIKPASPTS